MVLEYSFTRIYEPHFYQIDNEIIMRPHNRRSDPAEFLTREKVSQLMRPVLLNPFIQNEEERHPWSVRGRQELDIPFLRIWDCCSGSRPFKDSRMRSRAPDMRLDTTKARKETLAAHLKHANWTQPTPYISFTTSPEAVSSLANMRTQRGRGSQTLTVVDPSSRLKNGLPILEVISEMDYYRIQDPYGRNNEYYIDHYVCLWEVTAEEVVGTWDWDELASEENWYDGIIVPAFYRFKEEKAAQLSLSSVPVPVVLTSFDMSTLRDVLPCEFSTKAI